MARAAARDWTEVQPFPFAAARRVFRGGSPGRGWLAMRYFRRGRDGRLAATAVFGPLSEGAPGRVHGGCILTALDEALGAAAWLEGHPVLTVRLNAEFRRGVPLGAELVVETRITEVRRRLVRASGSLSGPDGPCYARANGEFYVLDAERMAGIFGRR